MEFVGGRTDRQSDVRILDRAAEYVRALMGRRSDAVGKVTMFGFLAAAALIMLAGYSAYRAMATPVIGAGLVAEPSESDLGAIGSRVHKVSVVLRNVSRHPVRILRIREDCGCTTAKLASREIPPGGRVPLQLHWDVRGRNGLSSTQIDVQYELVVPGGDAAPRRLLGVALTGDVAADVLSNVDRLTFRCGEPETTELLFSHRLGEAFSILTAGCNHVCLEAVVEDDGRSVMITANPPADMPRIKGVSCRVSTTSPGTPSIVIPIEFQ